MRDKRACAVPASRLYGFLLILLLCSVALVARAVNLQVIDTEYLQEEGNERFLRDMKIATPRGNILDRNGEPLAVSTPVDSIGADPGRLLQEPGGIRQLAAVLKADPDAMERRLTQKSDRQFIWIRRRLHPAVADQVRGLGLQGIEIRKEYRRFYPAGEVAAHLVGFTNIDDVGQEGLELAYNDWLQGAPGVKRVIKDGTGRIVDHVEVVLDAEPGRDLSLTIDRRLQYLAYRELKSAVRKHGALSGSVVLLDVETGEVLAMVNHPSYNPNNLENLVHEALRNRAVTDVFEPGSVMKPFVVASALETGRWAPDTPIDASPGWISIGRFTAKDHHNYGPIDLTRLLTKSSNVAAVKVARDLEPEHMWDTYRRFGFGEPTGSGFPGESAGVLRNWQRWKRVEQDTLSYGYGISVTTLQLAEAFSSLANVGVRRRPSLILGADNPPESVLDPRVARQVAAMLETVTGSQGTGKQARVENYRVAGKTGTSRKSSAGGYKERRYIATFAGFAPASAPRIVAVAMVNDPSNGEYYGGAVAAPLFSSVMSGALRLMNVPPDDYDVMTASASTPEDAR
ncbi:MAG: penicillin-binding protein 2 [Gammaproteobacteria bacterium]|nr:penicillin-binding protein 2 [Gammaproteobacteria bacterium]